MTTPRHIAVFDIGKTNAKLALVDRENLREIEVVTRPNRILPAPPWPHFDTEGHWEFLLSALARLQRRRGIDAIAVTTHGACAALLTTSGTLAAPVLDYEHDGPEELRAAYARLRPPFAETGSPHLPLGLNLGAQLHWQLARMPELRARIDSIVTWPQYWSFRLTGERSCDVTSLGCHTDLWQPEAGGFSSLPAALGLEGKIARPCPPDRVLGRILPEIAAATGLPPETEVVSGIHDSNASLLPYLKRFARPFAVVSTGTWVIAMAIGGQRVTLDPAHDTVMNVNALGQSVPSARFMGGRIYESLRPASPAPIGAGEPAAVAARGLMLLPTQDPLRPRWNKPE
ncbi:carbohydrate kinase, partial [Thioclava sp. BHET1]